MKTQWTVTVDLYVLADTEAEAEQITKDVINAGSYDLPAMISADITDAVKDA